MIEYTLVICPEDQATGTPLSVLTDGYQMFDAHNEAYCMKGILERAPVSVDVNVEVVARDATTRAIRSSAARQFYSWHFLGERLQYLKTGESAVAIGATTDYVRPGFTSLIADNPFILQYPGALTFLGLEGAPVTYPVVHMNAYTGSLYPRDITWEQEQFNLFRSHDHFHVLTPGYADFSAQMESVKPYTYDTVRYKDLFFQTPLIQQGEELVIRCSISIDGDQRLLSEVVAPGAMAAGMWYYSIPIGIVALTSQGNEIFCGCTDIGLAHISDGNGQSWTDLNPTHPENKSISGGNDMGCYVPGADLWGVSIFDLIKSAIPALNRLGLGVCQMSVTSTLFPLTEYELVKTLLPDESANLHSYSAPRVSEVVIPAIADLKERVESLEESSGSTSDLDSLYMRG